MPEINGLDLTKQIRAKGSDIPIIITSALSDSETILSAVDRGIVKYIVKPIDAETLENTLLDLAKQIIERKHNKLVGKSILTPDEKLAIENIWPGTFPPCLKRPQVRVQDALWLNSPMIRQVFTLREC